MAISDIRISQPGRVLSFERVPSYYLLPGAILLFMPVFAGDFVLFQIFGWTFILGIIALSLMFLAGYGGMVSLAQMTIAGLAGYMVAIFGDSAIDKISQGWPWYIAIVLALIVAVLFATLVGWLAVRTTGIYTIMITLAIAAAFFYFTRQNYVIFNGFSGFNGVLPPRLFGIDWRGPQAFYYLTLFAAVIAYFGVVYISRAPFGLALQGVRDNARRMAALGYNVTAHRVAAYAFSALLAGTGGILLTAIGADITGHGGHRSSDRYFGYCRHRRSASPHRALHRRLHLRPFEDIRGRCAPLSGAAGRALSTADRGRLPCHRVLVPRRHSRPLATLPG